MQAGRLGLDRLLRTASRALSRDGSGLHGSEVFSDVIHDSSWLRCRLPRAADLIVARSDEEAEIKHSIGSGMSVDCGSRCVRGAEATSRL